MFWWKCPVAEDHVFKQRICDMVRAFDKNTKAKGCSMCRGIVESDANSGGTGISSSINSGIIYLFTSTYVLIIIGAVLWYFRSRKYVKDQESKRKIKKRVASLID